VPAEVSAAGLSALRNTEYFLLCLKLFTLYPPVLYEIRIIIGSGRRPKTKQGIEGKIVRFRSGRLGIGLGI